MQSSQSLLIFSELHIRFWACNRIGATRFRTCSYIPIREINLIEKFINLEKKILFLKLVHITKLNKKKPPQLANFNNKLAIR